MAVSPSALELHDFEYFFLQYEFLSDPLYKVFVLSPPIFIIDKLRFSFPPGKCLLIKNERLLLSL